MSGALKRFEKDGSPDVSFLVGREVEQIWVWGPVRLILDLGQAPEPSMYVDAERSSYQAADGAMAEIDVGESPGKSGRILELLGQRVIAATVDHGELVLGFANGAKFRTPPDPHYEAWTAVGDGRTYVCLPSGDISVWR